MDTGQDVIDAGWYETMTVILKASILTMFQKFEPNDVQTFFAETIKGTKSKRFCKRFRYVGNNNPHGCIMKYVIKFYIH